MDKGNSDEIRAGYLPNTRLEPYVTPMDTEMSLFIGSTGERERGTVCVPKEVEDI